MVFVKKMYIDCNGGGVIQRENGSLGAARKMRDGDNRNCNHITESFIRIMYTVYFMFAEIQSVFGRKQTID